MIKRRMKATSVCVFVSYPNRGVIAIAMTKPIKLASRLMRPQLIVSPTPSDAICSTASSYATMNIGKRKKPCMEQATSINVLFTCVSAI